MTVLNDKEIEVLKGLRALNLQGFATTLEQQFENPKVFLKLTVDERIVTGHYYHPCKKDSQNHCIFCELK